MERWERRMRMRSIKATTSLGCRLVPKRKHNDDTRHPTFNLRPLLAATPSVSVSFGASESSSWIFVGSVVAATALEFMPCPLM